MCGQKGIEDQRLRTGVEAEPWPTVTDEAKAQYRAIFEQTGAVEFMEKIQNSEEKPLRLSYLEGRIANE